MSKLWQTLPFGTAVIFVLKGCEKMQMPTWNYGWTELDELRLESAASRLVQLSAEADQCKSTLSSLINELSGCFDTEAGEAMQMEYDKLKTNYAVQAGQMREAAAAIREYNRKMRTLWEVFQDALKEFWAYVNSAEAEANSGKASGGGGGGAFGGGGGGSR